MNRPIAEVGSAGVIEPRQRVLEPIGVIPFREILTGMSAAAFGASDGRMQTGACLRDHVVKLKRLSEISVEGHRSVGNAQIRAQHCDNFVQLVQTVLEQRTIAEDSAVALHDPLHFKSDRAGASLATRTPDPIEPGNGSVRCLLGDG